MHPVLGYLGALAIAGFALDNVSTWVALTTFADHFVEANPIARSGFQLAGLAPTLLSSFFLGSGVSIYIIQEERMPLMGRGILLIMLVLPHWAAAINNIALISQIRNVLGG